MGWKTIAATAAIALGIASSALAAAPPQDTYRAAERTEIRELFDRYAWAVDYGDSEAFVKLFPADGVVVAGQQEHKGTAALKSWVVDLWGGVAAMDPPNRILHVISNVMIDFTGPDTAKAKVLWTEVCRLDGRPPRGTFAVRQAGIYDDELVKRNGRWLFGRHVLARAFPPLPGAPGTGAAPTPGAAPPPANGPVLCAPRP